MKKKQSSARFEVIQDLYDNINSQNQTYFKEQIKPPHHLQDSFPKAILYTTAQVADMELKLTVPEFSQETLHQVPFAECITLKILRLTWASFVSTTATNIWLLSFIHSYRTFIQRPFKKDYSEALPTPVPLKRTVFKREKNERDKCFVLYILSIYWFWSSRYDPVLEPTWGPPCLFLWHLLGTIFHFKYKLQHFLSSAYIFKPS